MTARGLLRTTAALAALTLLCIFAVDGLLATAARADGRLLQFFSRATTVLEYLFLFPIGKFTLGLALCALGAIAAMRDRWNRIGQLLLFAGLAQLSARLVAGVLKNVFGRARPLEALATIPWTDVWWEAGSSFPSGHAAHFWGLFFPLILILSRLRVPLLVLPLFVSAARVAVGDHYAGDVIASAAIAAGVTWCWAQLFRGTLTTTDDPSDRSTMQG